VWAGIVLVLAATTSPSQSAKRLVEVRNLISARGARQALSILVADDAEWDSLLDAHDERRTAPIDLRLVSAFLDSRYEDIFLPLLVVVCEKRRT